MRTSGRYHALYQSHATTPVFRPFYFLTNLNLTTRTEHDPLFGASTIRGSTSNPTLDLSVSATLTVTHFQFAFGRMQRWKPAAWFDSRQIAVAIRVRTDSQPSVHGATLPVGNEYTTQLRFICLLGPNFQKRAPQITRTKLFPDALRRS